VTSMDGVLNSAIYTGWVRHRRYAPRKHSLRYRVFMMLLDLDELDRVFAGTSLWSTKSWALARFKRSDFMGDPKIPLDQAVRERVKQKTGLYPEGPIRLLTNLRYFGFIINPISCYYCFDKKEQLQTIIAEVNNTPWDERHCYVLNCNSASQQQHIRFAKGFHVSPFNPMNIEYDWKSNLPGKSLHIEMQNWREDEMEFDATLALIRKPITGKKLNALIWQYPFMTLKVLGAIYWEAIKLLFKGLPFYGHPGGSSK
jgi:DUF1365 family protein